MPGVTVLGLCITYFMKDNLIAKLLDPKHPIQHHLEIMACRWIAMQIQTPRILEHAPHFNTTRLHKLEIPLESAFPFVVECAPVFASVKRRIGAYQVYGLASGISLRMARLSP